MKIRDAKQACSAQLHILQAQRQTIRKKLQEQEAGGASSRNFDRVELSRELKRIDAQYETARQGMESIAARETVIRDAEAAKQQSEAASEACEDIAKILEVYRRISSGGKVPAADEKKLMEYSDELYMAAKNLALLRAKKGEDYDSLWEDEEESDEKMSPDEIAGNAEIAAPSLTSAGAEDIPEE